MREHKTVAEAAAASAAVLERVAAAQRLLEAFDGRILNGFGVLADPSVLKEDLRHAILALKTAELAIQNANWPTKADYQALDE